MYVTRLTLLGAVEKLSRAGKYGLDTETTGLTEDDSLFSIIVTDGEESLYFNFCEAPETPPEAVLPRLDTIQALVGVFANPDSTWFIANAKFDLRMLAKEGLHVEGKVVCIEASERVLRNNHLQYGLAACAKRRGLEKDDSVEEYIQKHKLFTTRVIPGKKKAFKDKDFTKVPFPVMYKYAEQDAHLHLMIGLDQEQELNKISRDPGIKSVIPVYENESRLVKTCFRMERAGIMLDRKRTEAALEYEKEIIKKGYEEFRRVAGVEYVNSGKALAKVFDRFGEPYPRTDKGNPSFTADWLDDLESPLGALINGIRRPEKRVSTYYSSFLHFASEQDIVRANIRQAGTETGRFSYSDPNLQNVPKEDEPEDQEKPFHVRECFIPRPGRILYSKDYRQQEFRMMLDIAGETALIKAINEGADVHDATAALCGITRKQAKTINFGLLYGMGIEKLARSLGISVRAARDLRELYFDRLPKVRAFIRSVTRAGEARGFVFNWFGRRCHIANSEWAYILPNHIIQGGCADVLKIAMNRIDERLLELKCETQLLLQVHDELVIESVPGEEGVIVEIGNIMEGVYRSQNGMRLDTSTEHSLKSWGYRDKIKGMYNGQKSA